MPFAVAAAGISAAAGIGGALISADASKSAAKTQADAANRATQASLDEAARSRADLAPFRDTGIDANNRLAAFLGVNGAPIDNAAELRALQGTPGYQFTLDQGLKSVQNRLASMGLGSSGAALKGAAQYATGLAQSTYQNNLLNPLQLLASRGESAAAKAGDLGMGNVNSANQSLIGGANATAAGQVGSANAISQGLNSLSSLPTNYLLYDKLLNGGSGSGGSGGFFSSGGDAGGVALGPGGGNSTGFI